LAAELLACPFCRQLFPSGEASACPECGIPLSPLAKLPPSHDALAEDPPEVVPPHMVTLPWTFLGRGRGLLALLGVLGLAAFFGPWALETSPNLHTYSGFELGIRTRWLSAAGIAFLVMVPLVISRRSVHAMRGSRFAVGFLAAIVLMTVSVQVAFAPVARSALVPVRFAWGWGLYACAVVAVLVVGAATRFGGKLEDLPAPPPPKK
jgi:hypothetical protein